MSFEVSLFRIDGELKRLAGGGIDTEARLESILERDISVASTDWLVIGRQVPTSTGGRADLICLDPGGDMVVVELKRNRTPREVVAQLLEYGWWARTLTATSLAEMFAEYRKKHPEPDQRQSLDEAFRHRFGGPLPEEWSPEHRLVLVSASLDSTSERIIEYLSEEYGVSIGALFFRVFIDGDRQYLARAWIGEQDETSSPVASPKVASGGGSRAKIDWNGETYANFGHHLGRRWEDAMKYGYIAAGGGPWYVRTLRQLQTGERVWVSLPEYGFAAVGEVLETAVPFSEFMVDSNGKRVPITEAPMVGPIPEVQRNCEPDGVEHFVRMRWIKAVPAENAVKEKGFFGNQNTVARPRDPKWDFTVRRLKQVWGITD